MVRLARQRGEAQLSEPSDYVPQAKFLNLEQGREFLYIFDYGDEWRFRIRLHAINPDASEGDYPRIVQSVGEAPAQYEDWEDEDADDGELTADMED